MRGKKKGFGGKSIGPWAEGMAGYGLGGIIILLIKKFYYFNVSKGQ